jgi:RNA polymerase sigma-70 factor (ECF subfamily)
MPASDAVLLERLRDDRGGESLRALYRRYADELYGFAYSALGDRGLADELVQDVFTRVWRHAGDYDPSRASFRTWLYAIARNVIVDFRRRASVRPRLAAHEPPVAQDEDEKTLDAALEQAALRWQVAAALERLSPEHREVVRLAHFDALTFREIAQLTGLPLGTVKSRAYYALRNLRLALEEMEAVP